MPRHPDRDHAGMHSGMRRIDPAFVFRGRHGRSHARTRRKHEDRQARGRPVFVEELNDCVQKATPKFALPVIAESTTLNTPNCWVSSPEPSKSISKRA